MSPDEQERRRSRTVHFTDKLAGKMAEGVSLFTLEAHGLASLRLGCDGSVPRAGAE
jgi:hypothetical protein